VWWVHHLESATTCKQVPIRRHCTWVFSVMNHLNATTAQDESPRLMCACGWMAKLGRFPMTDSAGAPLHSLGHRQGFVGDHRLQRGARALLGGRDGGVSLSGAVSTSMASFSSRRSRWARSRRRAIQPCAAGQQARGLVRRQVDS
jgi:hypothetical protein